MRIAVVHPGSGWILTRIARELCAASPGLLFLAIRPAPDRLLFTAPFDAIYYVDVQNCWSEDWRRVAPSAIHVGFFTHLDRNAIDVNAFRPDWDKLDGIVHMARRYEKVFLEQGWYPRERMTVIQPGQVCDSFPLRPLRLGVCQRGGFPGKGDPFLFEALTSLPAGIRRHVKLHIKGSGWRPSADAWLAALGPLRVILDEDEAQKNYPDFYRDIDYLLVPSLWEGGPMAVAEALASGVPVIAADVGWVPDLLTIEWDSGSRVRVPRCVLFPPGNADAMASTVRSLVEDRLEARRQVEGLTWTSYAEKLEAFVTKLTRERQ